MKKLLFFCLCFIFFAGPASIAAPQEVFIPGPSKFITRFTFTQLTGGVIIVKAAFDNNPDSLNFVLDTGSGGISLDSTTCHELNIYTQPSQRTIRGIAGIRTVDFAYNHTLKFPGLTVDSLNFHINDYDLLSGVYGVKIDGIIGFSFLSRYIIRLDYDTQQMDVFTNGTFKYPKGGYMLRPTIAGLPMQGASLKEGKPVNGRFFLDTGAGLCLLLSEEFCKDSNVLSGRRKRYKTVTEGLGGKKEMDITVLREFKIGNYKFKKIPIYIFEDEYNVTAYPYLGGLIGNDLLRRFNLVINYAAREVHLLPNSHFRDPFDYSYSGLGLFATGSEIIVADIITGSPADAAGLKAGDVIVGMNNNLSNNMTTYRTLLQMGGTKVNIIYRRDGKLAETKLAIKNIL
jgi:hypothetical protein